MGYSILHDPASDTYALIDPEAGRALGPVLSGPGADHLLEGFVGALGVDPATLPVWTLETRFEEFLGAVNASALDETAPDAPPAAPETPAADVARPAETPAAPTAAEGAPTDEPPAPAPADTDAAPGEQLTPGHTIGNVACPTCDGFGTVAKDGAEVTCPTCEGQRVVPRDHPAVQG